MAAFPSSIAGAYRANAFLKSLAAADAALILPMLTPIEYRVGERLEGAGTGGEVIHFPLTMVVSLGFDDRDGGFGLVGHEGLIGWASILGLVEGGQNARVLFDGGTALKLSVKRMKIACFASPTLAMSLLRFVQAYTVQLSSTIHANGAATLKQRLSAWLLMLHDRIDGDLICLTHQALAAHLQVRRASITDVLHLLESDRAVRCERRSIAIRDRGQLELSAGSAYGRTEAAYRRSIGPFGKAPLSSVPGSVVGAPCRPLETASPLP